MQSLSKRLESRESIILQGVICTIPAFLVILSVGIFIVPLVWDVFRPEVGDSRNVILRILPILPIFMGIIALSTLWRHALDLAHRRVGLPKVFLIVSISFAAIASIFLFEYFPLSIALLVCLPAWLFAVRLTFIK